MRTDFEGYADTQDIDEYLVDIFYAVDNQMEQTKRQCQKTDTETIADEVMIAIEWPKNL